MDFHTLPRRDLQAMCKRNAIRANMSNAAMADALRSLQSVKGIDEIRTAPPPPEMSAVKSAAEEVAGEEQRNACPLPRGGRSQATARRAAANKTGEGVPVPETLQMEEGAPRNVTVPVEAEPVSTGKGRTRRSRRSKVKEAFDQKVKEAFDQKEAAEQKGPIEPTLLEMKLAEEVAGEEQRGVHRCGRSQAATKRARANKAEEGAQIVENSQTSQNTAPRDATVPVETEAVSTGKRRTRRPKRSKVKETLDQKEEATAEPKEPIETTLLEMKLAEEVGGEEPRHKCPLPHTGRSQATASKVDEAALTADTLHWSQQNTAALDATAPVDAEAVSTGKRRMRRSSRSKAKMVSHQNGEEVAAQREPTEPTLFEENSTVEDHHHGCPLPRGGCGRTTRSRAVANETENATPVPDTLQRNQKIAAQEAAVHMEMEEVSSGKRRTRRSRRSKVQVALVKEEEAAAVANKEPIEKRCDDPNEEAAVDKEADKHQDGEVHFENPSICSGKRQKRRSRRQKVKMALDNIEEVAVTVGKELIADSSSVAIGSVVVSDSSCNKEEKVEVVEVGAKNFQEGIIENQEPTSTVKKSPSLATGGPVLEVAQDASIRDVGSSAESYAAEMAVKINPAPENKEHGSSLAGEPDQSYLLVNTLDRFVKPMCKFPVKEETKQGECWWMLM